MAGQNIKGESFSHVASMASVDLAILNALISSEGIGSYNVVLELNKVNKAIVEHFVLNGVKPPRGPAAMIMFTTHGGFVQVYDETEDEYFSPDYSDLYNSHTTPIVPGPVLTGLSAVDVSIVLGGADKAVAVTSVPAGAPHGTISLVSGTPANVTIVGNKVHAVKAGTSVITATEADNNLTTTFTVTVTRPALTGITIADGPTTVKVGKHTTAFRAVPVPLEADMGTVTWKSSKTAIAKIADTGIATGVKVGTAQITASAGGKTSPTKSLSVTAPTLTGFTVADKSVVEGAKVTMAAVAVPAGAPAGNIKWTSATPANATVNTHTGEVTGVKAGTSIITATSGGKTGTGTVTVTAASTNP